MFVGCVTAKPGIGSVDGRVGFLIGGRSVESLSKSGDGSTSKGQKHDHPVQPPVPSCKTRPQFERRTVIGDFGDRVPAFGVYDDDLQFKTPTSGEH